MAYRERSAEVFDRGGLHSWLLVGQAAGQGVKVDPLFSKLVWSQSQDSIKDLRKQGCSSSKASVELELYHCQFTWYVKETL